MTETMDKALREAFRNGVLWSAQCLRQAATMIKEDKRDWIEKDGVPFCNSIVKSGNVNLANNLNGIADVFVAESHDAAVRVYPMEKK